MKEKEVQKGGRKSRGRKKKYVEGGKEKIRERKYICYTIMYSAKVCDLGTSAH